MSKNEEAEKVLELISKIHDQYKDEFNAQAELFKSFFNTLNDDERNEKVKAFISKQNSTTRAEVIGEIAKKDDYKNVPYLGIPGSLGRSYVKVEKQVKKLIDILKGNHNNDILEALINQSDVKVNATTTSIMYLFFPEKFIPIAGPIQGFLAKVGIEIDADTWENYEEILKQLKNKFKLEDTKDFEPSFTIAFSFASWLMENQVDNILNKFISADKNKPKNIILTGIPGTGKTYAVKDFVESGKYEYELVQFHPSYDYEDFIEGLKPIPSANGQIEFKLVDGVFKKLCKKAYANKNEKKIYVMVIDEINRANLSRVFGELLYCLEYRDEFVSTKMSSYIQSLKDEKEQKSYSVSDEKENIGKFSIPSNVIILGTMNEVDRSIDAFDLALRRRFIWEDIGFNETALRLYKPFFTTQFQSNIAELIQKANKLNKKLSEEIGVNYQLGHTYYFKIADYFNGDFYSALCDLWEYHIKSIVREYCKIKFGENEIEKNLKEFENIIVKTTKD